MSIRPIWRSLSRSPFGSLLLALLGILIAWELVLDVITYRRLRRDLERDLGTRLVNVARLLATELDASIVPQFREGDESLPAYHVVAGRLAQQAVAAVIDRAYVVDLQLRTLVDSNLTAPVGRLRYGLLANQREIERARQGAATATPMYRGEEGRIRLSALAPLAANGRIVALVGVDASPEFFTTLGELWGQMALLGGASVAAMAIGGLIATRQVGRRLERLRVAVSRVQEGDFAARVEESGRDEIGALGRDLDRMIASVVHTRDYYVSVLGSLDVALLTLDAEGEISGANAAAGVLFGIAGTALVGRPIQQLLGTEPALAAFVAEARRSQDNQGLQTAEIPLGGGLAGGGRIVAVVASPLHAAGSSAAARSEASLTLWLSDITDLRRLEQRARRNERLASLGAMAGGLLHEIRNPLASMTVYLDLLRDSISDGEPHELVTRAVRDAARLNAFLQDFQIVAGLRPLRRERVRASTVVAEALAAIDVPPTVRIDGPAQGSVALDVDRRLVEHALRNLLQNAIEAVKDSGGVVTVEAAPEGSTAMLRVTDTGPGIASSEIERVFDPMVTTKPAGTGLGLTVVHRIVEAHGGSIELTSVAGSGSTFTMRLPSAARSSLGQSEA